MSFGFRNINDFRDKCGYVINGSWFPRVTKIVGIKSKPALHYFYASIKSYAEGERIKELSADEGTRIHEAAQDILIGKKPSIQKDIAPAIKAFREFIQDQPIEVDPEYIEKRVVNYKERFAGTVDALAFINGKLGVMDIKTSKAIYRDYNLQTAAYMATLREELKDLETKWILRIDQHRKCQKCGAILRIKGGRKKMTNGNLNGYYRKCVHEWGPLEGEIELKEFPLWENDYKGFLGAKKLWEWENYEWLKEVGYLE
jgi:hypothetical protein